VLIFDAGEGVEDDLVPVVEVVLQPVFEEEVDADGEWAFCDCIVPLHLRFLAVGFFRCLAFGCYDDDTAAAEAIL
jgi:hypothetical protein